MLSEGKSAVKSSAVIQSSMVFPQHCVESALVALVHAYQLTVCPYLLNLVQKVQNMDISADSNSLRIKEAGQLAPPLYTYFHLEAYPSLQSTMLWASVPSSSMTT